MMNTGHEQRNGWATLFPDSAQWSGNNAETPESSRTSAESFPASPDNKSQRSNTERTPSTSSRWMDNWMDIIRRCGFQAMRRFGTNFTFGPSSRRRTGILFTLPNATSIIGRAAAGSRRGMKSELVPFSI